MLAALFCLSVPAMIAEVVDSSANGFIVKSTLTIKAAPEAV
jgi:hypothetical protein